MMRIVRRLTRVEQGALFATLGYDNANRRTSLAYPNGTSTSYGYDVASRLTGINHLGPSGIIEALTYQYDAAGNRVSLTRGNGTASLLPNAVASATYDAANEQTQFASATLTYDANGNLTNDGVNTYQWDARNRLIGISGGATAAFNYDAFGRRTTKVNGSVTSQFMYDGNDVAAEIGGGAVGANYLRSLNIDEPFIQQSGTGPEFYHTDALSSALALSNSQGASTTTYGYEPFGKTTATGTSMNPFQYTGRENDGPVLSGVEGTGLYYYRARYYSPSYSRFLSEDPLELGGGDTNLYSYVWDNPLRWNDPRGTEGAVSNASIQVAHGPDGVSLTLEFNVNAPAGTPVTIDVGTKTVIEDRGNFSNKPFKPLPSGHQTKVTNQLNIATFNVNITSTPGYIQILTPGLSSRPTVLTGPVYPGSALVPCKYNCRIDKSYGYFPPKSPEIGKKK